MARTPPHPGTSHRIREDLMSKIRRFTMASTVGLLTLQASARAAAQGTPGTTAGDRLIGDYVVQDQRDGSPHSVRVTHTAAGYAIQWDANTPVMLVPRSGGSFRIAVDTATTVAFTAERPAARTLLVIGAKGDTTRGPRVDPAPTTGGFDGDDWAAARGGALFDSLVVADSLLFDAFYVRCDAAATIAMFTSDAEFYHDRNGLKTGEAAFEPFRTTCPRTSGVRRVVVPGSVRIFAIAGYGVVQLGRHQFVSANGAPPTEAKFIQLWKRTPAGWRATRTISVDHRALPRAPR